MIVQNGDMIPALSPSSGIKKELHKMWTGTARKRYLLCVAGFPVNLYYFIVFMKMDKVQNLFKFPSSRPNYISSILILYSLLLSPTSVCFLTDWERAVADIHNSFSGNTNTNFFCVISVQGTLNRVEGFSL